MNMPAKLTLADLYGQRDALLKKRADIQSRREKLSAVDAEAEAAAQALVRHGNAAGANLENWVTGQGANAGLGFRQACGINAS